MMMYEILKEALEKLESLKYYYELLLPEIEKEVESGKEKYGFGYKVDSYFKFLTVDKEKVENDEVFKTLKKNIDENVEIIEMKDTEGIVQIAYRLIKPEELVKKGIEPNIALASKLFERCMELPLIHGYNTLVALIARFEEFVAMSLGVLFNKYPEKYLNEQKVSFSEIKENGVSEIKELILRKEIDRKMREDYAEWLKLYQEHKFDLANCNECIDKLKEIYSRRNIIVHNSGFVNNIYLAANKDTVFENGDMVINDSEYLNNAFIVIKVIIFSICIEAIKMCEKIERSEAVLQIFNCAYEALRKKEYVLCENVFKKLNECKFADASYKLMSKVNYWISCKNLGKYKEIEEEIKEFDTSALSQRFDVAKYVLLEEYDIATEIIEKMLQSNGIGSNEINNWPLFESYRRTTQYESLRQKFKDEFDINTMEVSDVEGTELIIDDQDALIEEVEKHVQL